MKNVYILSDFDGTLPPSIGSTTVYSPFYKTLLKNEGKLSYNQDSLKGEDTVQKLFKEEFGDKWPNADYDGEFADFLIPNNIVNILHELLSLEGVHLRFISKNLTDYIIAVLRYQGFSDGEIVKIQFGHGTKEAAIGKPGIIPIKDETSETKVWVLDDDKDSLQAMVKALAKKGYISEYDDLFETEEAIDTARDDVHIIHNLPGHFNWQKLLESVKDYLQSPSELITNSDYSSGDESGGYTNFLTLVPETPPPSPSLYPSSPDADDVEAMTDSLSQQTSPAEISQSPIPSSPESVFSSSEQSTKIQACETILLEIDKLKTRLSKEYSTEKQTIERIKQKLEALLRVDQTQTRTSKPVDTSKALQTILIDEANNLDAHLNWRDQFVNLVKSFFRFFFGPSEHLNPLDQTHRNSFFYPRESATRQQVTQIIQAFDVTLSTP